MASPPTDLAPALEGCGVHKARRSGDLLDLAVLELDRRGASEDGHRHAQAGAFFVDLFDNAVEALERAVGDTHRLAVLEADRGLGPFDPFLDGADDAGH